MKCGWCSFVLFVLCSQTCVARLVEEDDQTIVQPEPKISDQLSDQTSKEADCSVAVHSQGETSPTSVLEDAHMKEADSDVQIEEDEAHLEGKASEVIGKSGEDFSYYQKILMGNAPAHCRAILGYKIGLDANIGPKDCAEKCKDEKEKGCKFFSSPDTKITYYGNKIWRCQLFTEYIPGSCKPDVPGLYDRWYMMTGSSAHPAPSAPKSPQQRLKELNEVREFITTAEYEQKKREILAAI